MTTAERNAAKDFILLAYAALIRRFVDKDGHNTFKRFPQQIYAAALQGEKEHRKQAGSPGKFKVNADIMAKAFTLNILAQYVSGQHQPVQLADVLTTRLDYFLAGAAWDSFPENLRAYFEETPDRLALALYLNLYDLKR